MTQPLKPSFIAEVSSAQPTSPVPNGLVQARGLCKSYRRGRVTVEALRGVDLDLPRGAFAVVCGPSGGGKSTLLNLLGGIDRPTAGQVRVGGMALEAAGEAELTRFRRDHVGFIFQSYNLLPSLSALDNAILPLLAKGTPWRAARRRGAELLEQVGLANRLSHRPGELSGGEQQRVAIARALVVEPLLVLADEPTGDLDSAAAEAIVGLMRELNQRLGATVVVATHNVELQRFATHSYLMRDGLLASQPLPGGLSR
jgi:putative ABC transport system ATP-binding protein